MRQILPRLRAVLLHPAWVAFTWLGMTAGVSLLATPARFAAETITRPVALDVGRTVFAALNKAEFVALIVLLVIVRLRGDARRYLFNCLALALILVAQSLWLQPELAARTDMIIAGIEPGPSYAHAIYSVSELTKLLLLAVLGYRSLMQESANHTAARNR